MIDNKFLNDIAKFTNSTISTMSGAQRQVRQMISEQLDGLVDRLDLVTRKDLDIYKEIAQSALAKVEELEKRLAELEKK